MYSVSSASETETASASAMESRMNWVLTAFSATSRSSAVNSSRVLPCACRYCSKAASSWPSWCTTSCSRHSISACTADSGSGTSVWATSSSSTLSRGSALLHGVELRGQLGEVVVGLGQLALLDRVDHDGDLGVGARVLAVG